jgi:hypothetical protein
VNTSEALWRRLVTHFLWITLILASLLLLGLVISAWMAGRNAGIAVLWGLGCTMAGVLVGFIFGIPRASEQAQTASPDGKPSSASRGLRVNTNLEQISDWLTKIIVGVSLVQAKDIKDGFRDISRYLGTCFDGTCGPVLGGGLILFHSILGMLAGYLFMRMHLSPLFNIADIEAGRGIASDDRERVEEYVRPVVDQPSEAPSRDVRQSISRIGSVSLDDLKEPSDLKVWARAKLESDEPLLALEAYNRAVDAMPHDIDLRVERAVAQFRADVAPIQIRDELMEVREIAIRRGTTPESLHDLYNAIVYASLFVTAPDGFNVSIRMAEEYLARTDTTETGPILVNLACAYGQKFEWLRSHQEPLHALAAREAALSAVRKTIAQGPQWKALIVKLASGVDPDADDLKIFADDDDFRKLLAGPDGTP